MTRGRCSGRAVQLKPTSNSRRCSYEVASRDPAATQSHDRKHDREDVAVRQGRAAATPSFSSSSSTYASNSGNKTHQQQAQTQGRHTINCDTWGKASRLQNLSNRNVYVYVCLFVCFIDSQHTLNQLRLQQCTTKA